MSNLPPESIATAQKFLQTEQIFADSTNTLKVVQKKRFISQILDELQNIPFDHTDDPM